jgi:hypothetical protein
MRSDMERSKIRRVSPEYPEKNPVDFLEKNPVIELSEPSEVSPSEASVDGASTLVVGSSNLYDENGEVRLIPAPSPDPRGRLR